MLSLRIPALVLLLSLPAFASGPESAGPASAPFNPAGYASIFYVDSRVGDDFTGNGSAAHPWATLQHGLESLASPPAGQRMALLIGEGRYLQPTFALKPRIDLYGGFASPGGPRDVYAHPSVLDGEENHRIAIGADDARLDGLQLTRGRVRGPGGALLCDGTSPTIVNCVFVSNRTQIPEPWNPPQLHETGNDGGAIACLNGAAPSIERNLFFENATECGRGGAISCDRQAAPRIAENVLANNRAGIDDPLRSGDAGAIAIFRWSRPDVIGNVVAANEAWTENDSGGIWVALWSSPRIENNTIVGNHGGDDGGGLFVGGQEHRYGVPLDPYPSADRFLVRIVGNRIIGNVNGSGGSGAMRITMESRVLLRNNVIADNPGGMFLQRSEMTLEGNTIWDEWKFKEDKASLGPSRFVGNILKGPVGVVQARLSVEHCMVEPAVKGTDDLPVADIFMEDGVKGHSTTQTFDPVHFTTVLELAQPLPAGASLAGRALCLGANKGEGEWHVIKSGEGKRIVLWGRLEPVTHLRLDFEILRTFTPRPDAPAGLGARPVPSSS